MLTEEAFTQLLAQLDPDPERAAEKYEEIRRKLMKFFRWRGCLQFEEYADTTIDRVARKIAEGAIIRKNSPSALFYGVALNVLMEHWRKSMNEPGPLDDRMEVEHPAGDPEEIRERQEELQERETRLECLRRCLRRLPSESLHLIRQYYSEGDVLDKERRRQIAERLNLSAVALRSRAFRIRGELERCVDSCLKASDPDCNGS